MFNFILASLQEGFETGLGVAAAIVVVCVALLWLMFG